MSLVKAKTSLRKKVVLITFGFFLFLFLLELGLRLAGFVLSSLQEYTNKVSIRQKGAYRIMCLGESTTALGGNNSYPSQLEEILNQPNIGIKFSVINKGWLGTNTSDIVSSLEKNLDKYKPDMVITMMGINDQLQYLPYEDVNAPLTIRLLKSLRIYKLATFLKLHLIAKVKGHVNLQSNIEVIRVQTESQNYNMGEESLKKAIELNLQDGQAYRELARCYMDQGMYRQAEVSFKKAIELSYNNEIYIELGNCYMRQIDFTQAEIAFRKAIELNPHNYSVYIELGNCYKSQGKSTHAEIAFKKAIELNPQDGQVYLDLAHCYMDQGKYAQAKIALKKAIELNPMNDNFYFKLGWFYIKERMYTQAEIAFKKALELNPRNERAYAGLAILYEEMGEYSLAEEYYKNANEIRLKYYNPITVNNYQRLKEILDKRGIKLVCVQYPMRSIEPLKRIFKDHRGIIFVDNERVFKEKVMQTSHDKYFADMFGGDFGHCSEKGNRLLAENIAQTISREWFKK